MMIASMNNQLIKCFEDEFGNIETGIESTRNHCVQIVKYHAKENSPQFVSTLGLSSAENITGHIKCEWIMEFSPKLVSNHAASMLDYFLSLYLDGKLGKILRGSYLQFSKKDDRIWKNDNSKGIYFTIPVLRSQGFQKSMANTGVVPIWVVPITGFEIEILNNKGWKALEGYWDKNDVDLHTTFRI